MLRALVRAAERFEQEGKFPPTGYKPKSPKWILNLGKGRAYLEGPFGKKDLRRFYAPDRQRSGKISEDNLKPYLLLDDARYAIGKAAKGKEHEAKLLHRGFVELLEKARQETGDPGFSIVLDFLNSSEVDRVRERIQLKDTVLLRVEGRDLIDDPKVQAFWAKHLAEDLSGDTTECSVCGHPQPALRVLPREIVIQGQKCQVTSFNLGAFLSYGKAQTTNAPLCFPCGSRAIDALDFLSRSVQHRKSLWFDPEASSLQNQLAVFWLDRRVEVQAGEQVFDIEVLLGSPLGEVGAGEPPVTLSQLQDLLHIPWKPRESALTLEGRRFYLAVLSANKGRLAVREWFKTSLDKIRESLGRYLRAVAMTSAWGEGAQPVSIRTMFRALEATNPNVGRALLRTAYLAVGPPEGLWVAAVDTMRNPKILQEPREAWRLQALASALKLGRFYGKEEVNQMSELNLDYRTKSYLCGRLLAVLEEAQLRAANFSLNKTLVDRFYGAASTAPASVFGNLVRLATTAHLPEVGKEVNLLMEEVMSRLDEAGGFPKILTLTEQAEFGLGFYHQRAAFRSKRGKAKNE